MRNNLDSAFKKGSRQSNLAIKGPSIGFNLVNGVFNFTGGINLTKDDLIANNFSDSGNLSALAEAKDFLISSLKAGSKGAGISPRTLVRAKDAWQVKSFGVARKWYCRLPEQLECQDSQGENLAFSIETENDSVAKDGDSNRVTLTQ